jgi:hypothetical protein
MGARTRAGLDVAITATLGTVTVADAAGWFTACGYPPGPAQ